jgi:hypothetical protein
VFSFGGAFRIGVAAYGAEEEQKLAEGLAFH